MATPGKKSGEPKEWRPQGGLVAKFASKEQLSILEDTNPQFSRPLPSFLEFVTSPTYLGQHPPSRRQLKAVLAVIGTDPYKVFSSRDLPNEGVFVWGKGSGKDFIVSEVLAYLIYIVLCMNDPWAMVGMAQGEPLDICNVATNAEQANTVFFAKLQARIERPCFAEFGPVFLKGKITFDETPGLTLWSLHSMAEGWEGKNVLAWVMDEASAFRTNSGGDNAEQVHKALRSSATSRFGFMHWIGMVISFPRKQQGDFALNRYLAAETNPNIYGDRGATWEINPRFQKGHPMYRPESDVWVLSEDLNIRVPKEFEEDFLNDGIDAMTRYMAQPPLTEGGFFENPHTISESVNRKLQPIIARVGEREQVLQTEEGVTVVRKYVTRIIDTLPPRVDGAPYFMHGDPGLKKDSFTIAVAHSLPETKMVQGGRGSSEVALQRVVVDFVLSWDPRPNRPVDLLDVDETILELCRHYGIKKVTFDRWDSAQSIQALVRAGIDADDMSFSNPEQLEMYRYLRLCFYNDMIELAPLDDATQNELKHIKEKNGKMRHDIYGKDRADAVAAVVWNAAGRHYSKVRSRPIHPGLGGPRRSVHQSFPQLSCDCYRKP